MEGALYGGVVHGARSVWNEKPHNAKQHIVKAV